MFALNRNSSRFNGWRIPIRDILFSPDGHWLAAKTLSGLRLLDSSADREAGKKTALGTSASDQ